MKKEFDGKMMREFAVFISKKYSYLTDNNDKNEKEKSTKKCIIK